MNLEAGKNNPLHRNLVIPKLDYRFGNYIRIGNDFYLELINQHKPHITIAQGLNLLTTIETLKRGSPDDLDAGCISKGRDQYVLFWQAFELGLPLTRRGRENSIPVVARWFNTTQDKVELFGAVFPQELDGIVTPYTRNWHPYPHLFTFKDYTYYGD